MKLHRAEIVSLNKRGVPGRVADRMSRLALASILWLASSVACSPSVAATHPRAGWALDSPPTEMALMDRLHELVKTDPAGAVGLAAQGDRRFPGSPMAEERALLTIRALVNLEMYGAAQAKAEDYYSRYPDGMYSDLVASLTGVSPQPRLDGGPPMFEISP